MTRSRTTKKIGPSASKQDAAQGVIEDLPQAAAINAAVIDNSHNFLNLHSTVISSVTLSLLRVVIVMIICLACHLRIFSGICHELACCCSQCLEMGQEPVLGARLTAIGAESRLASLSAANLARVYPDLYNSSELPESC